MVIKEDLIYFLKNGRFENINFGITRKQLTALIGKPDFILPEKSKMPMLFEYDNIEFYFEDECEDARLQTIKIDCPVKYSRKGELIFNSHRWTIKLTIEQVIKFLHKHKISFEEKPDPMNLDFWRLLETKSGVRIDFTNQRDEKVWELHSFGKSIELNSTKPKTKQISCEVEAKFYEQLKKKAHKTGKSIAHLCKEIIESHLEKQ